MYQPTPNFVLDFEIKSYMEKYQLNFHRIVIGRGRSGGSSGFDHLSTIVKETNGLEIVTMTKGGFQIDVNFYVLRLAKRITNGQLRFENPLKRQPKSDHDFIHDVALSVTNFKGQIFEQLLSFRLDEIQEIDFQVDGDLMLIIHVAPDGIGMYYLTSYLMILV